MDPTSSREHAQFARRAREMQARATSAPKPAYDFIVCGAGASGSVVARRLAENPEVQVLLLEAGGSDESEAVLNPALWPTNLGSDREWGFKAQANPHLNGREIPMAMGKGLGGGSSINVMVWARGHRSDWDLFASEAGDARWAYANVLEIYRRIENWQGPPDPAFRGTGGPVWVQPASDPSPIALAMLDAARELGIPVFDHPNGRMMEQAGGAAITDMLVRHGQGHSLYRAYVHPWLDRPKLAVFTEALVRRVVFQGRRAVGVELMHRGQPIVIGAHAEVVLSLGAIQTPKVLMHSGIGDRTDLNRFGIPLVQHLPGVGQNLQDHVSFGCTWEFSEPQAFRPLVRGEAMPGNLKGEELDRYIRDAAVTYWHQSCTARMGRDAMSVVDGTLKVHGVDALRVADASTMPRVTTGNTQAPCAVIGEQAAEAIKQTHGLSPAVRSAPQSGGAR